MVFNVPASKASIKQNRFEFTIPGVEEEYDGPGGVKKKRLRVFSVPKLKFMKPWLVGQLEGEQKVTAMLMMLDTYHPGISKEIEDPHQMGALYEAWAQESGISTGESSASTDS